MNSSLNHSLAQRCAVPARANQPLCKASGLAAIRLSRPEVGAAVQFFKDFGLTVVSADKDLALLRGTSDLTPSVIVERGPAAYLGFSLMVDNAEDLQHLAATHHSVVQANHQAIGGQCVVLRDPDGLQVQIIHGWQPLAPLPAATSIELNQTQHTPRINRTVRLDYSRPPAINKLGHTVLGVSRFADSLAWYQHNFGLIVSDFQMMDGDDTPVVAFMRCDRGDTPTDHHTIAIGSAVETGHLHTAFELPDMDAVVAAGIVLKQRRYHHSWGVGRHILGSQIFDYWRDPCGDMFEHYADSDLFDNTVATGYHRFHGESLHQWGPAVPADMTGKIPSLHLLKTVFSRLRSDDDLSLRRLVNLIKASS